MEAELERFRKRKEKELKKEESRKKFQGKVDAFKKWFLELILPRPEESVADPEENDSEEVTESQETDRLTSIVIPLLKFLFWLFLYIGFLKIGFGAVYFATSLLVVIYLNTNTGKKRKKGQPSAYSVFNKNCESLDGTLKAEHFEKQMLFRSNTSSS